VLLLFQESTEEELERLLDKIMVLFRFIHGTLHMCIDGQNSAYLPIEVSLQ